MKAEAMNHWPLPMGRKAPAHAAAHDSANPFAEITCPTCRAVLASKVDSAQKSEKATRSKDEQMFFAGTGAHYQAILGQRKVA